MSSFVWNDTEVKKTGRVAKKEQRKSTVRSNRRPSRIDVLYEITPANEDDGTWKKWIRHEDLYAIVDEDSELLTNEKRENYD